MAHCARFTVTFATLAIVLQLAGCAATTVETTGTPLAQPLCRPGVAPVSTVVYWGPQWRAEQKEVPLREAAALRGIEAFLTRTPCLAVAGVHRLSAEPPSDDALLRMARTASPVPERLVLIIVRELGPRLVIGLPHILEGGTEVLIEVRVLNPRTSQAIAGSRTLWRNGGTFVIKGVKTLEQDMSAALQAVLMPGTYLPAN